MVKIVIAGGTGNVAREIIDVLVAEKKHDITVFTRKNTSNLSDTGLTTVEVDYGNKDNLVKALLGVHTVLSFIFDASDPNSTAEKSLIDASIEAEVKRFAPSEWSTRSNSGIPWYVGKDATHQYLQKVNSETKVLEYSLFQPGLFTNYFSYPHPSTKHLNIAPLQIDFENRRAIVVGDGEALLTLTTVQDLAKVVAAAVDYEGAWPEIGGIQGGKITKAKLLELGGKIRGKPFIIDRVKVEDLEAGNLKTSWIPAFSHPSVPKEQHEAYAKVVVIGALLGAERGAYDVSDEWNRLLPHLKLTTIEDFLSNVWKGKP